MMPLFLALPALQPFLSGIYEQPFFSTAILDQMIQDAERLIEHNLSRPSSSGPAGHGQQQHHQQQQLGRLLPMAGEARGWICCRPSRWQHRGMAWPRLFCRCR